MISIEQINGEISLLEEQIPTHMIMQKLASLYIVRDHMGIPATRTDEAIIKTVPTETVPAYGSSEFLQTVSGKSLKSVMLKMDDLVMAVRVLNPKLYENLMIDLYDTH